MSQREHGPDDACGVEVPAGRLLGRAQLAAHVGCTGNTIYSNAKRHADKLAGRPTPPPAPWFIPARFRLGGADLWTLDDAERMREARQA